MENREDWIWKLRMYSTNGMNSQNLPRFSGINQKKNGKQGMSRIIIYTNFKMNEHNLVRFQNSLKNSFGMLRYIIFMRCELFF